MKKVEITLGKDGSVKVEAFGFVGNSCEEAAKFLDSIFGEKTTKHKPSYFEEDQEKIINGVPSGYCG